LLERQKIKALRLQLPRNELENLRGSGYTALPSSGSFPNSLLGTLPPVATTTLTVNAYNEKTKQVTVHVIWKDPGTAASSTVSLSTLITQTGGLP